MALKDKHFEPKRDDETIEEFIKRKAKFLADDLWESLTFCEKVKAIFQHLRRKFYG